MPKLKTNAARKITIPVPPGPVFCVSTYDEYTQQRIEVPNVASENIDNLTEKYKNQISGPIHALNPAIEMGQYFVIPVAELREMLDSSGDNPEYIHICCALRDTINQLGETKTFPVTILLPVKKTTVGTDDTYEVCKNQDSVYIEAYPCPPAPNCPHTNRLTDGFFKSTNIINDFTNLR